MVVAGCGNPSLFDAGESPWALFAPSRKKPAPFLFHHLEGFADFEAQGEEAEVALGIGA
jgi:hypothetical protein